VVREKKAQDASSTESTDSLNAPTLELPGLDGEQPVPAMADAVPPSSSSPLGWHSKKAGQTTMTQYGKVRKGMTSGPTKFCCMCECFKGGVEPAVAFHPNSPQVVHNLDDMMSWAHDFHDTLAEALPFGALQLLHDHLRTGTYSTAFSGIDTPGSVA